MAAASSNPYWNMTPAQASAAAAASWSPSNISASQQQQINSSSDPTLAAYYANLTGQNDAAEQAMYSTQAYDKNVSASDPDIAGASANSLSTANFAGGGGSNFDFSKDINAINTVGSDLSSGNYGGAITAAEMGGTFGGGQAQSFSQDNNIMQALLTNPGQLDPSKQWDQASDTAFAQALFASSPGALGVSSSGQWGNPANAASDEAAWAKQYGNAAPDLNASLGARPSEGNFMDKATPYIDAVEIGVMTGGLGAALTPAIGAVGAGAVAGATSAVASDAVNNQALTLGSVGKGALMGAAGGVAQGPSGDYLGGGIQSATGLNGVASDIAGNAIVQGAVGAGTGALLGGANGALLGGLKGVGSGITSTGTSAAGLSGTVAGSAIGAGSNYLTGAAASALTGGASAPASGVNYLGAGAGVQGNNGNMASTDQTLGQTIAGALPGVIQGAAGVYGSQNAAEAMTNADTNAINTQTSTLGNINNIWGTQQSLGQGADTALGAALGTNGQPADYSGFENMPGYQFAVQQGTQAINRQAAAMGSAYTPNTAAAVGQYVTGTAASDYNTYISQLMGAAGLGSTANAGIATPTYQTGANISTLQQNQGYAQASGVQGAANAVGGLFGQTGAGTSLIGAAAGKFLNGGAGGGGGGGYSGGGYNLGAPAGGDVSGGVDPNTGIPTDIEAPNYPGAAAPSDPSNFIDPNYNPAFGGDGT